MGDQIQKSVKWNDLMICWQTVEPLLALTKSHPPFGLVPYGCRSLVIRAYTFVEKNGGFEKILDMKKCVNSRENK